MRIGGMVADRGMGGRLAPFGAGNISLSETE